MKRRDKTIIKLTVIAMILTLLIGTTYAYFTASVTGNETAKDVQVEAGTMSLELDGTTITSLENAFPGSTHTINFSVENTGSLATTYSLEMIDVTNTFVDRNDLVYTITSTNGGGSKSETLAPNANEFLINKISIDSKEIQNYTMTIHFKETGDNQNDNQNVMFIGKVQINSKVLELPDEYQEVAYIDTSGIQYIDTQFVADNKTEVLVKLQSLNPTGVNFMFGSRTSDSSNAFFLSNDSQKFYPRIGAMALANSGAVNEDIHEINMSSGGIYWDNKLVLSVPQVTFTTPNNFLIGSMYHQDEIKAGFVRIYYFKIWDNEKLKYSFIPCYRKADNIIGMYNLIDDEFYINSGSGNFTAGPNV